MTLLGWAVVHSLWIGTLVAGASALTLGLVADRRPRIRYLVTCAALFVTIAGSAAMALTSADPISRSLRQQATGVVERSLTLPVFVRGRAVVVPAVAALWLGGVAIGLGFRVREWRRMRRLRTQGWLDAGDRVRDIAAELRPRLGIGDAAQILASSIATAPMVVGWRQPIVLLPARSLEELDDRGLRAVLAHELAHVRRRDYPANLAQRAADTLLFHHPAARWLSARARIEREYCCDDVALAVAGEARTYVRALATLDVLRDAHLGVAASSGTLLDRLQRIAGHPRPTWTFGRGVVACATALLIAGILLVTATLVPPSLPLDVKLRSRMPAPQAPSPKPQAGLTPAARRAR